MRPAALLALLPLFCSTTHAQEQTVGSFKAKIEVDVRLQYLLFQPKAPAGEKLPLIVFLHGAGERGDDINRVKVHGPPKIVETKKDFPFIVLSPQSPVRSWWNADALAKLIDHIIAKHPVDPDRVYLTGLNMGGFGSWDLAAKYPEKFAAVAPICGGGKPETAARIKHLPIWAFHGEKDSVVPLIRSQEMVDALKNIGGDIKLTVYPGVNHDSWTATYANPKLYEWFLEHRRKAGE